MDYEFNNSIINSMSMLYFLVLITILWLGKPMSLALGNITEEFRGKEASCLQITLKWFRKKKKDIDIRQE